MKTFFPYRILFSVAALYDGLLGLIFLLAGPAVFSFYGVTEPNHWGYIDFPAALLVVFAIMFISIAKDPLKNSNLIPYGILLKASYCGMVWKYSLTSGIPSMWKPFAITDFLFGVLFAVSYWQLKKIKN